MANVHETEAAVAVNTSDDAGSEASTAAPHVTSGPAQRDNESANAAASPSHDCLARTAAQEHATDSTRDSQADAADPTPQHVITFTE